MENIKPNRYSHSKIYKLVCDSHFYIGSTINELRVRLQGHKKNSKVKTEQKVYKYFNEIGWENVKIILIEAFSCENRQELLKKEDEYIQKSKEDENCLNFNRASISYEDKILYRKEYNKANKTKFVKRDEEYYKINKERILEQKKEYALKNKKEIAKRKKIRYEESKKNTRAEKLLNDN